MAGFRQRLKRWYDKIPDWLWPHLTGEPIPPPDERCLVETPDAALLEAVEHALERRLSRVDERLRTVETKLVALLTLTSILSAAVTVGFATASTMTIHRDFPSVPVWISLVLVVYLGVNLLRSLWATVSGLMRRGYKEIAYEDMIPRAKEDQIAYRVSILSQHLNHAEWNDWVLDQKVSELAVAHVALRNALSATGGVILMAFVIALLRLL
jgi:hypothetical protein